MTTPPATHFVRFAAIYCRISNDPSKRGEGVEAQERWGRAYAAEHWPGVPVKVFVDNSVSGDSERRNAAFGKLRAAVRAGHVAHMWTSNFERLTRSGELAWAELTIELLDAGIEEIHTRHDGVVLVDDMTSDMRAVIAKHERRRTIKRIRDKKGELARQGRPFGSMGFGYRHVSPEDHEQQKKWLRAKLEAKRRGEDLDRWVQDHPRPPAAPLVDERGRKTVALVDDEAQAIRDVAEHILSGWTLTACAVELNRRGFRGHRGGEWTFVTVTQMLRRASLAGLRVHHGEVIGDATWPAILDEGTWRAVVAKINSDRAVTGVDGVVQRRRATRPNRRKGRVRHHLLAGGLAWCGVCGKALVGGREAARPGYRCSSAKGGRGCVFISAAALEEWVADRLFDQLDRPEFLAGLTVDDYAARRDKITAELRDVDVRRTQIAERQGAGKLTLAQFDAMNDQLIADEHALHAELAGMPAPPSSLLADPSQIRAWWPDKTFDEQRATLVACIDRVIVHTRWRGRVTAVDVAARVGVTKATVSNVMRGKPNVSAETRRRVLEVAAQLGYDPVDVNGRTVVVDDKRVSIEWRRA